MATKKTKSNSGEGGNEKATKLAAEVAKLRAENERLKTDREKLYGRPMYGRAGIGLLTKMLLAKNRQNYHQK